MDKDVFNERFGPAAKFNGSITVPENADRTLLAGLTNDDEEFHVYQKDGDVHVNAVRRGGYLIHYNLEIPHFFRRHNVYRGEFPLKELVDVKMLYPEACDADICQAIVQVIGNLNFAPYNDARADFYKNKRFKGTLFQEKFETAFAKDTDSEDEISKEDDYQIPTM
jgi:hypothetical protein